MYPFEAGLLIPLLFIVFLIIAVIGPSYFKSLDRKRMYDTLRAAIDKGQPLPPEFVNALKQEDAAGFTFGPDADLRRGLVLIGVGIGIVALAAGLYFGLSAVADPKVGAIVGGSVAGGGAIPGMIGVAYLLLWQLNRSDRPRDR